MTRDVGRANATALALAHIYGDPTTSCHDVRSEPVQDLIFIPVSAGEMFDKITILEIKEIKIIDAAKRLNVARELAELKAHSLKLFPSLDRKVVELVRELRNVNSLLWQIEDNIREHERIGLFDSAFIDLARSVYIENDRRARLKRDINIELRSALIEEKSYKEY